MIRRTRHSFGLKGSKKHAANVAARAARMREEITLRSQLKSYLLKKRAKEDRRELGKDEIRKIIAIPNRKQLRKPRKG